MIFIQRFQMSRTRIITVFCLFWSVALQAQNPLFREDQLYLGVGVLIADANQDSFSQTDFSGQLQLGFIRDFPIRKDSKWALGLGIGYDYRALVSNLSSQLDNQGELDQLQWLQSNENPEGFRQSRIVIPLELRWRNATPETDAFWRIHSGVKCSYIYFNRFQSLNSNDFKSFVDPWQLSAHFVIGFNTWNFYVEYEFVPWLKADFPISNSSGMELNTLQLGVLFYFL